MAASGTLNEDFHLEALLKLCRICGHMVYSRKSKRKLGNCSAFEGKILTLFNINIRSDLPDIHPKLACTSCLQKIRNAKHICQNEKSYIVSNIHDIKEFWKPHQSDCNVCLHYK